MLTIADMQKLIKMFVKQTDIIIHPVMLIRLTTFKFVLKLLDKQIATYIKIICITLTRSTVISLIIQRMLLIAS